MGVPATVVFTDLHGSTAVFEALGNALATETITGITTWIASQCELANGRVVKMLGDGVLALFPDALPWRCLTLLNRRKVNPAPFPWRVPLC